MIAAKEGSIEIGFHDFLGKARPQNAGPHAEHIGIVVLSGFGSRIAVIAKGCADAFTLLAAMLMPIPVPQMRMP